MFFVNVASKGVSVSVSSLFSTLTGPLASVENKELTETLTPLDATLTKNIGGRPGYG